ncbi:MAG: DinB family protein [Ferruginibacter sp.]
MQIAYDTETLIKNLMETEAAYAEIFLSIDPGKINSIPSYGGWTPGELLNHVTKATNGMPHILHKKGKTAEREVDQKVEGFRKIMTDFHHKFESPDFIVPDKRAYDKAESLQAFQRNFVSMPEAIRTARPDEIVEGLPMGEVTKLELMHFTLFHLQRHLQQLKNIKAALG